MFVIITILFLMRLILQMMNLIILKIMLKIFKKIQNHFGNGHTVKAYYINIPNQNQTRNREWLTQFPENVARWAGVGFTVYSDTKHIISDTEQLIIHLISTIKKILQKIKKIYNIIISESDIINNIISELV